jgi:uncharacterized membrane protein YjjP (DUF1212 family)
MSQPRPEYSTVARCECSTIDMAADRTILERSDLVLACAHVLHTNGQSTHETVQAAERLGTQLGLQATMIAHWEELELRAADGTGSQVSFERGSPTGINMDRVASAMSAIENCALCRPPIGAALENIKAIAHAPPAPTWLFTLAAAAGAAAMAAIFGVHHLKAVVLIMVSAAAGAVLRRTLAWYSANILLQPLCAALLAGMIGALAVRYNLSSSLRLVAVCPCMILVPGPRAQRSDGSHRGTDQSGRLPAGPCWPHNFGNLCRIARGNGYFRRILASRRTGQSGALMGGRDRCGRGGRRIQCFLLNTIAHVGMASRDRHAGPCREMERSEGRCWIRDRHLGRMSVGRRDPCSSRASLADAIRSHWFCFGSIDDAGCLSV